MKMTDGIKNKILSVVLALAVVAVSLPAFLFGNNVSASVLGNVTKVSDPSTMDSWMDMFPADSTENAGRIWTDKSVFTDASAFSSLTDVDGDGVSVSLLDNNNFLVALSALASNKSIIGYSYTPTDTILVLDVSGSMSNSGYVSALVTATNNAMSRLLELNKHNRIGVIVYSSSATIVLPLDRYTQSYEGYEWQRVEGTRNDWEEVWVEEKGIFFTNDGNDSISINRGVQNSAQQGSNNYVNETEIDVTGGTYMQSGVFAAMKQFTSVIDTVIPDGVAQAGTQRTPTLVIMSDGLPTSATSYIAGRTASATTIGNRNIGDGTTVTDPVLQNAIDFVNQLTAANAVAQIKAKYNDTDPLVYTLSLGASGANLNSASLNPSAYNSTDTLWDEYVKTSNGSSLIFDIETASDNNRPGRYEEPDQASVVKLSTITSVDQKNYVTNHFPASNADGLISAFDAIVKQIIIQSLYYPTLVSDGDYDHDGYIEFIDDIGHYMEVKDIKGILLDGIFFTGERLAANFNPTGGDLVNADGTYTDLGNNLVWSVMERLGIENVVDARDLINSAYYSGQLGTSNGKWSNYIGWYADNEGNFLGHWHEGHTDADRPNGATYINRSYGMLGSISDSYTETDLMYVSIQVHTRISDSNVSLIWRIPASLIPVLSYNISIVGDDLDSATDATINYSVREPITLLFEVGLSDEINAVNLSDIITDKDAHIFDVNEEHISDDGKYYFYTNWWNDDNLTHENPSKVHDTTVLFEPSVKNERYYYSENTPVLIKNGNDYVKYSGAKPTATDGNTYYREYVVFEGNGAPGANGELNASIVSHYEVMSDATIGSLTDECRNSDGTWDVPMGVIHRVFEPYNVEKAQNTTGTIHYSNYPVIDESPNHNGFYVGEILGNNGRLAVDIPQGIKISKTVDNTLYGTDIVFSFNVTRDGENGTYASYLEDANGDLTASSVTFVNGTATVSIKANQSVYILGLDDGNTYTVSEVADSGYRVSKLTVNGQTVNGTAASLTVNNDGISSAVFENTIVINTATLIVSKEVITPDGIDVNEDQLFTFEFYRVGDEANKSTFTLTCNDVKIIDGLTTGQYVVREINVPDGYSPVSETVNLNIDENAEDAYSAHFVNEYNPEGVKPTNVNINGRKVLDGRDWMEGDSFSFRLQVLQRAQWIDIGDVRTVTYNENGDYGYLFDFSSDSDLTSLPAMEIVGEHYFRLYEVVPNGDLKGVEYDTTVRYFSVTVTDKDLDGKLEIDRVNGSASVTVTTDVTGTTPEWTVNADFNNKYFATVGDELVIDIDKTVTDLVGAGLGKDGYEFGLFRVGGTNPIITTAPTDTNGKTSFSLTYSAEYAGQTFHYEVREIVPENALLGMTYSTVAFPVTVQVFDNFDGTVTAKVVNDDNSYSDGVSASFENVYEPDGTAFTISGKKVMEGRDFADEFTFRLLDASGNEIDTAINSSKADGGVFTFDELTFDTIGTYEYTVEEVVGTLGGVTYYEGNYKVVVTVTDDTDNDGKLNIKVTVGGEEVTENTITDKIVITNVYETDSTTITIRGIKTLNGRTLTANEFAFELFDENGISLGSVTNSADGSFSFAPIDVDTAGEYVYTVKEIAGDEEGMTYDESVFTVTVTVTDNGEGAFDLSYSFLKNGQSAEKVEFVNTFVEPQLPPVNPDTSDNVRAYVITAVAGASAICCYFIFRKKKIVTDK